MKIGIVCFNLGWLAGGPRLVFSLARELKSRGHTVVIYAPEFSGAHYKELWQGLDIRIVKPLAPLSWSGKTGNIVAWIVGKLRQERLKTAIARQFASAMDGDLDIVNVHDFAYPVGFFYKQRNPRARVVWIENDPPFMHLPKTNLVFDVLSRLYNWLKRFTTRRYFQAIDAVTVLDFYNRDWCAAFGLRARVVRLGVDFPKFFLPPRSLDRYPAEPVRLLGLGALNPYRRYEDIVRAVKIIRDRGYNVSAQIISNNAWKEDAYQAFLLNLVRKLDVESYVTFHFRGVTDDELRAAFGQSHIFVYPVYLPPPRNGFGFSIGVLEAIAAGLPPVICRTTTSTEVLEDGNTALFVRPMSPEDIASKIVFLIENPVKYRTIVETGQKFVKEQMTWERYARGVLETFENVRR